MNNCINCNKETSNPKFCSSSCAATYNNKKPKRQRTKVCKNLQCDELILSDRTYCNTHKNDQYLNRKPRTKKPEILKESKVPNIKLCKDRTCSTEISKHRTWCDDHKQGVDWSKRTIQDMIDNSNSKSHYYSHIRDHARRAFKNSGKPRVCKHCGYDKHIEVAHIHAISEFPKTTSISTVNDPNNLIALCRNCHWELDYMDLTIEDILTSCNG